MLRDGGHVERAERAEKPALALRRFDGEQLIEKRRDPRGGGPGDDGLGEHLESFELMRVEELGVYAATAAFCCACSTLAGLARCSWTGCCASTIVARANPAPTPPSSACSASRGGCPQESRLCGRGMVFDWSGRSVMSEV